MSNSLHIYFSHTQKITIQRFTRLHVVNNISCTFYKMDQLLNAKTSGPSSLDNTVKLLHRYHQ